VSAYSVLDDGTANRWFEINFNHRQAVLDVVLESS